jgi:hypothetical protein
MTDGLYGLTPDPADNFGINLGALAPRGERNVLIASLDALLRVASNPFFPYVIRRIEEGIDDRKTSATGIAAASMPTSGREAGEEEVPWNFSDMLTSVLNLMRDRSDSLSEPP